MTFSELRLCMAIHRANLGGRDRTRSGDRHRAVGQVFWQWLHLFGDSNFPWSMQYRKSRASRMKVMVALAHGDTCYFKNRGKGPCCEQAEWGHIIPRSRGGPDTVENGQIECRAHNHQRGVSGGVMTIEEYCGSPLTTHKSAVTV